MFLPQFQWSRNDKQHGENTEAKIYILHVKRQNFNFKILSITQESFGNTSLRMNCPQIEIETKFVQPKDLQETSTTRRGKIFEGSSLQ